MKKSRLFITIIILFISIQSLFSQLPGTWDDLPNAPFLNNYKHDDIYFINPNIGWLVNGPVNVGDREWCIRQLMGA